MKLVKGILQTSLALVLTATGAVHATNKITGDYNGDGNQDAFNQALTKGASSSLTAEAGSTVGGFHISWTDAHPDIAEIDDWSAESYSAYSANLNSSVGDELLLLGKRQIILLHGDIITPIVLPKDVQNAIVSWDANGNATYTSFDLDIVPDNFNVLFGDFDGDGYQEILLQGHSAGSTSYILNSDGSISETLSNGYLGLDWSESSFDLVISDINNDGIDDIQAFSNVDGQGNQFVYMNNGKVDIVDVGYNQTDEPITATLAGSTGGEFRVSESGAATYAIPLSLPGGTAGVVPQLSLNYASNAGNGPIGVGWSLSGLSAISRCGKNMAQNDGIIAGIKNTSSDRFCMDGQQLFSDNTYGSNNASYYTETFNNTDITSHGGSVTTGPEEWRIKTRAGDTHYYGKVGNDSTALIKSEDEAVNRLWLLRKTVDLAGNSIEYGYEKEADSSEFFIKEITYGGNENANTSSFAEVEFIYADDIDFEYQRTDRSSGFAAGSSLKQTKLLKQIRTYNDSMHVKTIQIFHEESNAGLTRVNAIQECSYLGNCLQPVSFEWSDIDLGFTKQNSYVDGATRRDPYSSIALDLNGDGLTDHMYLDDWGDKGDTGNSNRDVYIDFTNGVTVFASQVMSPTEFASIRAIDYNNDGTMDFLYESADSDALTLMHWNTSVQKLTGVVLDIPVDDGEMTIVDLDGDASMDILRVEDSQAYWYRNKGLSSSQSCVDYGDRIGRICTTTWSLTEPKVEVGINVPSLTISDNLIPFNPALVGTSKWLDLNGDGVSDLISKIKQRHGTDPGRYTYTYSYFGLVFNPETLSFENFGKIMGNYWNHPYMYPTDINGDGNSDILYVEGELGTNWHYRLSKGAGAGFSEPFDTGIPSDTDSDLNNKHLILDYDNDGYQDFLVYKEILIGGGMIEAYSLKNEKTVLIDAIYGMGQGNSTIMIGNFNASSPGMELRAFKKNDKWINYSSTQVSPEASNYAPQPNTLKAIIGSNGARTDILYSALSDNRVYTNSSTKPEFPALQITPFYNVVEKIVSETGAFDESGNELSVSVSHKYEDFRVHTQGRGQLGFKKLISIDDQTGIKTVTEYMQEFPFVGTPLSTTRELSDETVISTAVNNWEQREYFGRVFPYLASSVEKNWTLDSDATPDDLTNNTLTFINQVVTTNTYEQGANDYGNIVTTNVLNTNSEADDATGGSEWFNTYTTNDYGSSNYTKKYARLQSVTVEKSRSDVVGEVHSQTSQFEYFAESHTHNGSAEDGYAGMLKKETIFKGDNKQVDKEHRFDEFGNKTSESVIANKRNAVTLAFDTTATERKSQTVYSTDGRNVVSVNNDLGFEKTFTYESRFNGVSTETGANGLTVSYDYDELGVKFHTQAADGTYSREYIYLCEIGIASCPTEGVYYSESRAYASDGSNLSGYSRTFYNKMGQEIVKEGQTFGNKKLVSRTEYDKFGRVSKGYMPVFGSVNTIGPNYTTATYDALGRMISQTEPGDRVTTRDYEGTSTININAIGQSTVETKNINGELGRLRNNDNKEMTYLYDTRGNFVKLIDSSNNEVEMVYDNVGHKIETKDLDKGNWQYKFNGFGELVQQTDARGVAITQEYDVLGRMIRRVDNADVSAATPITGIDTQTTCWIYDTAQLGETGVLGKGLLHKTQLFDGSVDCTNTTGLIPLQEKIAGYDSLARAESSMQKLKAEDSDNVDTYLTMSTFEETSSRVLFTILPREVTTMNHYDDYGNITKITDAVDETIVYREVNDIDKFGNINDETYGNGISATKYYNDETGYLESVTAGSIVGNETLDFTQYFDDIGNVTQRNDNITGRDELFGYVEGKVNNLLNRITSYSLVGKVGGDNKTYSYDALGNLKSKSDMGDDYIYAENGAGVHALTSIKSGSQLLRTFTYDANGNMVTDTDWVNSNSNRTMVYGAFEKPVSISKGNASQITFRYGSGRERYRRIDNVLEGSTAVKIETTYLGGYEKVIHTGGAKDGKTEHKYMLGGVALKIDTEESGTQTATKTRYLHKDHLGSVVAITDEAGVEKSRFRYDPFGKQYTVANQSMIGHTPVTSWLEDTQRGFTGHEMLSSVDVIHMNGRIYDANIGRFMQADAYIQAPKNMQSMNRYSYVLNNPLSYTDPSGHFFKSIKKYWRTIASIAIGIAICAGTCTGVLQAMAAGAASGAVATGSLKGAITGAFSAAIFFGIGQYFEGVRLGNNATAKGWSDGLKEMASGNISKGLNTMNASKVLTSAQQAGKTLSHAIAGGAMSKINGGKFGHGFASAGVIAEPPV